MQRKKEKPKPWMTGFTSSDGDEQCAVSSPKQPICNGVSSCLTGIRCWTDGSSTSIGSSLINGVAAASCLDSLGFFMKNWLKTALLLLRLFSLRVLLLTAAAGAFGDIGGDSKFIFDNCCLLKKESSLWTKIVENVLNITLYVPECSAFLSWQQHKVHKRQDIIHCAGQIIDTRSSKTLKRQEQHWK